MTKSSYSTKQGRNVSYCDSWKRSYTGTKYCWLMFQQKMVNKLLLSDNAKYCRVLAKGLLQNCYTYDSHSQKTAFSKKGKAICVFSPFPAPPLFQNFSLFFSLKIFQIFTTMFYRISCGACWGRCGKGTCKLICHTSNYLHWYKVVSY